MARHTGHIGPFSWVRACAPRAPCRWCCRRSRRPRRLGLEAAHDHAGGHLQALEDLARLRIDAAEIAALVLHGAVPELAVHPGDAGDEAIRLDRAQDGAGLGVDLVDLAGAVLADPERPLGPGQARVAAVGRAPGWWRRPGPSADRPSGSGRRRAARGICRRRRCRPRRRPGARGPPRRRRDRGRRCSRRGRTRRGRRRRSRRGRGRCRDRGRTRGGSPPAWSCVWLP